MDLSTSYLGLSLPHPLMPGASPLVDDLGTVRALEDAGAAAIVMHSLFEEQLLAEQADRLASIEMHEHSHGEAESYFPTAAEYRLGPDRYLEQIHAIRQAVSVPVIGSLNGTTVEGWLSYAARIEQAGAAALELNFYHVATDPTESAAMLEHRLIEIVETVRATVKIPIAVKLSPFFSSLPHLAQALVQAGADGLVLFNRFYQPDFDPERLEAVLRLSLSTPEELLLRLRWLAILSGRLPCSFAATGGVHSGVDALKAMMAGADAVQVVAALLKDGPGQLAVMRTDLEDWLEQHEYDSLRQCRASMSLERCPNPQEFERGNYVRLLQSWRPPDAVGSHPKRGR